MVGCNLGSGSGEAHSGDTGGAASGKDSGQAAAEGRRSPLRAMLAFWRLLAGLSASNQKRPELAQKACEALVSTGLFASAWLVLKDKQGVPGGMGLAGFPEEAASQFREVVGSGEISSCCQLAGPAASSATQCSAAVCTDCPLAQARANHQVYVARLAFGQRDLGILGVSTGPGEALEGDEVHALLDALAAELAMAFHAIEAEEERRDSEDFLRATLDALPENICVLDLEGRIVSTNAAWDRFAEANGVDPVTVGPGKNYLTACEASTGEGSERAFDFAKGARAILEGRRHSFEMEYPCHSPTEQRWFRGRVNRLVRGHRQFVVVVHEDITRRVLAEKKTREQEAFYHAIVNTAPDAILVADAETGVVIEANGAAAELIERPIEDLIGRHQTELHPPEELEHYTQIFREVVRGTRKVLESGEVMKSDGGRVPIELNASVVEVDERRVAVGIFHDLRSRKRSEAALAESERQLTALLANLPGMAYRVYADENWTAQYLSPGCLELTGYLPSELCGTGGTRQDALIHPEDQDRVRDEVLAALDEARPFRVEYRMRTKLGTLKWVSNQGAATGEDANGNPIIEGIILDITDRKQAESKYEAAIKTALSGYVLVSLEGARILDANNALSEMTGYSTDELLAMSIADLEVVESPEEVEAHGNKIRETGQDRFESRYRCKDGNLIDVEVSVRSLDTPGGGFAAFIRDITERKQAAKALQEKVEEIDRFFTASLDLLCIADVDARFIRLNPSWQETLGHPLSELEGQVFLDFVHPGDKEATLEAVNRLANQETILNFENRYRHRDGTYRWIEWRSIPQGNLIYASARDTTERKQTEAALRRSEEALNRSQQIGRIGSWVLDIQRDDLWWSPGTCRIFGVPPHTEMNHDRFLAFVHPDDRDYFSGKWAEALQGTPYEIDHRIVVDGQIKWVYEKAEIEFDAGGNPIKATGAVQDITDRKQTAEALRESEEKHRRLFETMSQGVVYQNAEGRIISANPAAERILGLTLDQLMGKTSVDPDWRAVREDGSDLPGEEHPVTVARRTGKPVEHFVMAVYNPRKQDKTWIDVTAIPLIPEGSSTPTQVYATFDDITQRRKAQERLRASEELLNETSQIARIGGWEVDLDASTVYWTQTTKDIHEVPADFEPTVEGALGFYAPESRPVITEALRHAREDGVPYELELCIETAKGERRWVHTLGKPEFRDGRCVRLRGTVQDITVRREAELALRESEERYRLLIHRVQAAIIVHDATTKIIACNPRAEELLGLSFDQLQGREAIDPNWSFLDEDGAKLPEEKFPVNRVRRTREPLHDMMVGINRPAQGDRLWVTVNAVPVLSSGGVLQQIIVTATDITERKHAQEEAHEARKAAEEANQAKSRFLASMSHELRTPLNAIIGFSEFMQIQPDMPEEKKQRNLQHIHESGHHLLALINDLLDVAKVEAGKMEIDWQAFNVCELCTAMHMLTEEQARRKNLKVHIACTDKDLYAWADHRLTQQTLLNLISNAIKFTPEGGTVTIDCENLGEKEVRISVADTGVGIPHDKQHLIFNEFVQVEGTRDSNLGGTGLGLTLCKRFVELQGGRIGFESEPGQGSTFWFTLPKGTAGGAAFPEPELAQKGEPTENAFTGCSVLVAEDNIVNMELLLEMLGPLRCTIYQAADGVEALKQAEDRNPDLIFMDIQMPRMSGLEAARRLRATPQHADTPIIALSASADDNSRKESIEAGCNAHLAKPASVSDLTGVLLAYLGHRQGRGESL